jgi:hypothetical protein
MLRRLIGLVWTATVIAVLVRKFAPGVWTSGVHAVREKATGARGPTLVPTNADGAPAEAGIVPDPNVVMNRPSTEAVSPVA